MAPLTMKPKPSSVCEKIESGNENVSSAPLI